MKTLILLLTLVILTSCAGPRLTEIDVELEKYRMAAVAECYKSKIPSQAFAADPRDQAILLMAEALANRDKPDSCVQIAGMNAHEARAKIAESQNASLGMVTGNLVKGATTITGIIVGGNVLKEGMKNSGDKTNITGDNNTHVNGSDQSTTSTTTSTSHTVHEAAK